MPEQHRALDWLARRHDGESAALIAHRAGVTEEAVRRATNAYGPFPRPTQQLNRTLIGDQVLAARTQRWVNARRSGRTTTAIARSEGVAHQIVSRATRDHGPYPAPDVVERWVAQRREGRTLAAIADEHDLPIATVRRATHPYGPFPVPGARLPEGLYGRTRLAQKFGVSVIVIAVWQREGRLPEPDFVTKRGRPVWLDHTVESWLEAADIEAPKRA